MPSPLRSTRSTSRLWPQHPGSVASGVCTNMCLSYTRFYQGWVHAFWDWLASVQPCNDVPCELRFATSPACPQRHLTYSLIGCMCLWPSYAGLARISGRYICSVVVLMGAREEGGVQVTCTPLSPSGLPERLLMCCQAGASAW